MAMNISDVCFSEECLYVICNSCTGYSQVLSMLVAQSAMSRAAGAAAAGSKPCLAINHIRDQLIPPQDRRRKDATWQKVCKYIR